MVNWKGDSLYFGRNKTRCGEIKNLKVESKDRRSLNIVKRI